MYSTVVFSSYLAEPSFLAMIKVCIVCVCVCKCACKCVCKSLCNRVYNGVQVKSVLFMLEHGTGAEIAPLLTLFGSSCIQRFHDYEVFVSLVSDIPARLRRLVTRGAS